MKAKLAHKKRHHKPQAGMAFRRQNPHETTHTKCPKEEWWCKSRMNTQPQTPQTLTTIGGVNAKPTPKHTTKKVEPELAG